MKAWQWASVGLASAWVFHLLSVTAVHTAHAAPVDVVGSANVAVDTYKNSKGSFVLWSDGRITDAASPSNGLQPSVYQAAPASARISDPQLIRGPGEGSPNVAVRALPRSDATYVLFADGKLKKPGNADAAAPAATPDRILRGTIDSSGSVVAGSGFSASRVSAGEYSITFASAFAQTPSVSVVCHKSGQPGFLLVVPLLMSSSANSFQCRTYTWKGEPTEWAQGDESFDFTVSGE